MREVDCNGGFYRLLLHRNFSFFSFLSFLLCYGFLIFFLFKRNISLIWGNMEGDRSNWQAVHAHHIPFISFSFFSRIFHPPSPLHILFSTVGHHGKRVAAPMLGFGQRDCLVILFSVIPRFGLNLWCASVELLNFCWTWPCPFFTCPFYSSSQIVILTMILPNGYQGPWSQARLGI